MVARETSLRADLGRLGIDGPVADRAAAPLLRFADLLREEAIPRGFLGPAEADRLITRHILDSAAIAPLMMDARTIVDVGSGAGLPGVVLALLCPARVQILDGERKRVGFVQEVAADLGIDVGISWMRAEAAGRSALRESFDAAVARALAAPPVVLELLLPLVRVGGAAVVAGGPTITAPEIQAACSSAAALLGGGSPRLEALEVPGLDAARWGMIVVKKDISPEKYPRRVGIPARRPIA